MAFEVDIFEPRHMDTVVRDIVTPKSFILETFFKIEKTFCTKSVDVDFVKGKRQLAPFIHPRNGGEIVENRTYTTKTYTPPTIAPKVVTDEEVIMGRMAGEALYSNVTPADRAIAKQVEDFTDLKNQNKARKEWMAAQTIFTGTIPIIGKGLDEVIDFSFTNMETIVDDALKWDSPESDPLSDLKRWKKTVQKEGSVNCDICIMSDDVVDAFLRNATVMEMFDNRRFNLGVINPKVVAPGVNYIGTIQELGIEIYEYNEWYLDNFTEEGVEVEKPLVPEGTLALLSSSAQYSMYYGAVTIALPKENKFVTMEGVDVPIAYMHDDPAALFFTLKSRPLTVPKQVDSWFVAHVL